MDFLKRTWAEIDTAAIKHNFEIIKNKAGKSLIMAVVKADCYGHGTDIVIPVLDKAGADAFAVSNIEEAIELRDIGIKKPILILGFTPPELAGTLAKYDISQCVYSEEFALALSNDAKKQNVKIKIHIKLDTGMGRIGFDLRDSNLLGIAAAIKCAKLENLIPEGIFTHFAVSDRTPASEDGFTDLQYKRFAKGVDLIKKAGLNPEFVHCCNSAAFCLDNDKHLDMSRPGIILYGLKPSSDLKLTENFIPVMTLKSTVSMVKEIKKGETVSYGRTFTAQKRMKIATVAVGYADGYPRALSNKGYVLINGKKAYIVGRVCMDQMAVDVTNIENVKLGDEVILFGKDLRVEALADMSDTINYEIVCGISKRVPRIKV
ncbi:MAG: alanine racemase [Clostridia bacterium]|nr:alanine racemase [Clostridia bacterium]